MLFKETLDHDKDRIVYYKLQIVAKVMSYIAKQKRSEIRFHVGEVDLDGIPFTTICENGGIEAISPRVRDAICAAKLRSDLDRFASVAFKEFLIATAA